jgi:hypothetical protein
MKIVYNHNLSKKDLYSRITNFIPSLIEKHSEMIANPKTYWNEDKSELDYSVKIMSFQTQGKVELKNDKIILEGSLPGGLFLFSGKIKKVITTHLDELLR